jgi:hypothetical protein
MTEQNSVVERALEAIRAICRPVETPTVAVPENPSESASTSARNALSQRASKASEYDGAYWYVRGQRVRVFPRCPQCLSHYLYRNGNSGLYECLTCNLQAIPEEVARKETIQ